ncbi:MAG: thiol reductant ABC exporter subunit CydC [Chloroflexi bacterium RBG_16_48_8]|nr:MAG: thiol reductant ABC exporter subunit CydC [Chloroflexi bacterium RBG_16_48_8]
MRTIFGRLLKLNLIYWQWMSLSVLLGAATIGSSLGLMSTSAYIIAMAALQPSIADLQLAIVGVRFFGISRGVFRYLERLLSHQTTFRLLARIRIRFYEGLEPLAPAHLLDFQSGDILARIISDIETLQQFFLRVLAPPLIAAIISILAGLFIARYHLPLAWLLISGLFLAGVLIPGLIRSLSRGMGQRLIQTRAKLQATLTETLQGAADLLALNADHAQLKRVNEINRTFLLLQRQTGRFQALGDALSGWVIHLTIAAVLIIALPIVSNGGLSGVDLTVITLAIIASFEAVLPLSEAFQNLETTLAAGRRLFEVIDAEPTVKDPLKPLPRPETFELQSEALSFQYEETGPLAIADLSFHLPEGGCLAIVGPSGAGKSSLVNLLLRFWDPSGGRILLGGQDLRDYSASDLRSWMAVLSQNTQIFNGTIKENLLLARPEASEEQLIEAARRAQVHDFIMNLPETYETWVGEGGVLLSGGERQRLALARVLLKDTPILILDEPSANLDPLTEQAFFDSLCEIIEQRTTLLISHRLVAMDLADQILVLHHGRLIEQGDHISLLKAGGFYRRMWDLQMQAEVVERIPNLNFNRNSCFKLS